MSTVDLAHLRQWLGKQHHDREVLSSRHARLMAATLGLPQGGFQAGAPLPPLWHWLYFLEGVPPEALGPDGHPARGGFLPPVPLPNRMWAGGNLAFHAPLPLEAEVEKRSSIVAVEHKQGRSGDLIFVTVRHELSHDGQLALTEHQDLVYKEAAPPPPRAAPGDLRPAEHTRPFLPDATTLFRYSALTFNGHRIHYDADYCRRVEGYAAPVVHGPLLATMLAALAEIVAGKPLRQFHYRGLRPSLLGAPLTLNAASEGADLLLWVALPDTTVSMTAKATF